MERPRRNVAPPESKPYTGTPAPGVEVVPLPPYEGEKVPPRKMPPEPASAREITFTNLARKAVEEYYGNACYYHRVLRANGLSGLEILGDGDELVLPARARAADMVEAARWRAKLAERL